MPPPPDGGGDGRDLIVGFGSLINKRSRGTTTGSGGDACVCVRVRCGAGGRGFGYLRSWNFRSSTGFTALGLRPALPSDGAASINGVVFRAGESMEALDKREAGYLRVEVPVDFIELLPRCGSGRGRGGGGASGSGGGSGSGGEATVETPQEAQLRQWLGGGGGGGEESRPPCRVWTYVPMNGSTLTADEDNPICQSYIDCALEGALLDCGGEDFAREFIRTTFEWAPFYLDDTPMSRRPWLNRPHYKVIDALLDEQSEHTCFKHRKHPEEYAVREGGHTCEPRTSTAGSTTKLHPRVAPPRPASTVPPGGPPQIPTGHVGRAQTQPALHRSRSRARGDA